MPTTIITIPESSLAISDGTAGDAFTLTNGPPENGFQTSEFTDPASAIIFANQTDFIVVGGGTSHAVTLDNPNPAAGLEDVTFETLGAGSDVEGGSSSGSDITVQELQLEFTGAGDIGDTRALRTQLSTLYVNDAGNVRITNGVNTPTTLLAGVSATGFVNLTNNGTINTALSGFPGIIGTQGVNITTTGSTADLDTGSGGGIESSAGAISLMVGEDINLGDAIGFGGVVGTTGVNLSAGRNITLNADADIEDDSSGIITINAGMAGAGGNITMLTSPGSVNTFPIIANAASTGSISLTTGAGGTLTVASTGATGIESTNGAITLAADAMVISAGINSGIATTTLEPVTAGQAIALGRTNAPGVLGLTQTELNEITTGTLRIGDIIAGNITITAAISNPAGDQIVTLENNGTISEGGFGSLSIPNLRISSTGPVTLGSAGNIIATLAANATNGLTVNDDTHILTVGTVDTVSGLVAVNNAINLTADAMNLGQQVYAGSAIVTLSTFSAAQQISLGGTSGNIAGMLGLSDAELGEITALVLRIDAVSGNITTGGTISSHAGYSTLSLATAGDINLTNDVSVTNLALNSGLGIAVDGTNSIGTAAFSNAANNVVITDFAALTIGAVDGLTSSSNLGTTTLIDCDGNMTFATGLYSAGAATLTAVGAAFVDKGNGAFVDVTAPSLSLAAQTGVGTSSTPLQTQIGALAAATTTGGIFINNDAAAPGTLNIGVGAGNGVQAGSGDISIINNGTIDSLIGGDLITGTGNITLKALGADADVNLGDQTANFTIFDSGSTGLVDVEAGRDLTFGNSAGAGAINASGSVKLVAGRDLITDGANFVIIAGGTITATAGRNFIMESTAGITTGAFETLGGAITLTAGAGGTMTLTSPNATAVSSGGGNITLTADFLNIGKSVSAGSGYVLIQPVTVGEQIGLGSASLGGLTLTNTELDDITAKTIIIGDSTAGEVSLAGTVAPTSGTNLAINTGAGVIATGTINLGTGVLSIGFDQSGTGATVDLSNAAITASAVYVEGGAGNDTFISGGTGETFIGGSGADTFEGTAAHLIGDTITNLKLGDKIDLLGLAFSPGGTATLDTGNLLQIEEDGQAIYVHLNPSQNFAGDAFVLSSDGQGGTDISPEPQQQLLATGLRFVGAGRSGTASDTLVLQNTADATPTLWTVSGASAAVTLEPSPGPGWTIDATGDAFDTGSDNTILWQNTVDLPVLWEINGGTIVNAVALPDPGPGWTIEATGDAFDTGFDNTILWENTSDLPVLWEMNGATIVNDVVLPDPGPGWTILGTGDFFQTGFNNTILWQNSAGLPALWEMNGGTIVDAVALPNPGPGWSIRAIGNFFGDGHADSLLWQDTGGLPVLWEINGGTVKNVAMLPNPGSSWTIEGVGVVTGNGDYDIFLEDTSGQVAEWSMNGSQLLASNFLTSNTLILNAPNTSATGSGSEQITFNSTNQTFIDGSSVYTDTVIGFSQPQGDRIHLTTDTVADALAHATLVDSGQDTLISLSDSSTILLKGVTSINSSFFA